MSEDTWSLIAAGINGTNTHAQTWTMARSLKPAEPYTNTLFDIHHGIALTDDQVAEREEWVQDLMSTQTFWNLMAHGLADRESPQTLSLIMYDIALTDDQVAEREEWVQDLMNRPEDHEEAFEADLDNWESNRD